MFITPPKLGLFSGFAGYALGDQRGNITISSSASTIVGTASSWLNGVTTGETTAYLFGNVLSSSIWVRFTWGQPIRLVEALFYQSGSQSHGVWQWQGSEDGGTTWENIGSTFTLGGATSQVLTELASNTRKYATYRMLGVSGSANPGPYIQEFQFKSVP
jgi:nicotinamide riboside transporter PnuC